MVTHLRAPGVGIGSSDLRGDGATYALPTETLTFLFTDIEGSTVLLRHLGHDAYAQVLVDHHSLIRSSLATHEGTEVSTQGDGFFAVFSSPSACVLAVIDIQRALASHRWPADQHVRVRMGIHCGEVAQTATGFVGIEVHRAARVAAVAHGAQVLLSATAAALVRDSLPSGASLEDLGLHRLKDLGRTEQIYQLRSHGLESDFPPLRSLDNPALANNLPAQLANFVGRELEVAEVRRLVESTRLVTLTGAGGSGKTRLGMQVAAELLDGSGDGVWLVELAPVSDEDVVASTISETLGIAGQGGRPALEALLDALAPQNILIMLDNCEHLIGACAKVADAVMRRCPQVHLLTTSREPLGIGGEAIYRVPSLSLGEPGGEEDWASAGSDAVALFMDRASAQGVELALDEETGPLVLSICRRLDGMPLAIELAAARLRSLSLSSLHDRLDQRFRLLTGGSRSALPRQQTLRATVDWSYSLLNGPEQSVLRRLSVFVEGFDLEAAEAVCGLGDIAEFDVTDLLGSLVDKSLVVAEPMGGAVRYRLLETIRQYSAEHLVELDEGEAAMVAAAHCAYFLSVAESAAPHLTGPDQGQWFARLDTDQANLRRALEHAADDRDRTELVLRFSIALRRYWWVRPRGEETMKLLLPVLQRPEAQVDPELLGGALMSTTVVARTRDTKTAHDLCDRAIDIARHIEHDRLLVESLWFRCALWYFAGDPARGFPLGQEAVERARLLEDDGLMGESLAMLILCSEVIEPANTEELFTEAIGCTERSGDLFLAAVLRNNAGVHALRDRDIPAARSHLEQAAVARKAIGAEIHNVSVNLGWVLREEGDGESARSMFEDGLRVSRRIGDRSGNAYAALGLACLAGDSGDWHRAAVLHGTAQAFMQRSGEVWQNPEDAYRDVSLEATRAHLGDEFPRAYAEGEGLSFDKAVDLAFGTVPSR